MATAGVPRAPLLVRGSPVDACSAVSGPPTRNRTGSQNARPEGASKAWNHASPVACSHASPAARPAKIKSDRGLRVLPSDLEIDQPN